MFVTNLAPGSGVRLHLWPEKRNSTSESPIKRVLEVTSRMVRIPSGPAPRQVLDVLSIKVLIDVGIKKRFRLHCTVFSAFPSCISYIVSHL